MEGRERCRPEYAVLESRRPKWNPRTETYELPFSGRANWASARNFQLIDRDGAADKAVLLYGKLEEDEFALDYSQPLALSDGSLHCRPVELPVCLGTWPSHRRAARAIEHAKMDAGLVGAFGH